MTDFDLRRFFNYVNRYAMSRPLLGSDLLKWARETLAPDVAEKYIEHVDLPAWGESEYKED